MRFAGGVVFLISKKSQYLSWLFHQVGEVSRFAKFLSENGQVEFFLTREKLWGKILLDLQKSKSKSLTIVEFGVAHGYATDWWITRTAHMEIEITYQGFDTFTGLPASWNSFASGSFSNHGIPPAIELPFGSRFHTGLIEETLTDHVITNFGKTETRLFIFDFDLHEPSLFAYNAVKPILRAGDLIYFDEAKVEDEFKIISENLLKDFSLDFRGSTFSQLYLRLK
jgi:hypothetical protein